MKRTLSLLDVGHRSGDGFTGGVCCVGGVEVCEGVGEGLVGAAVGGVALDG